MKPWSPSPNRTAGPYMQVDTNGAARLFKALVLPHDADDNALHLDAVRFQHDRLHRWVGGLQPDAPIFAIELLQRHVGTAHEGNHHLAVVGGFTVFDDDEVTIANLLVDHR